MSFWDDAWNEIKSAVKKQAQVHESMSEFPIATLPAAAGAAAGAVGSAEPTAKLKHPAAPSPTPGQAFFDQLSQSPAVAPGEALKQSAQAVVGAGPLAGQYRTVVIWGIIIVVGLIGVWGLLAPGGGVALIERKVAGR